MWRKVPLVTLALIAVVVLAARLLLPAYVTSASEARDLTLRANLQTLRAVLNQYTLDRHRRPLTLDDLVTAGYLKAMPVDPMTRRTDTWILECSSDSELPGIVSISPGDASASKLGIRHCN